jgi:DNA-binding XRE family transcriptional regulator
MATLTALVLCFLTYAIVDLFSTRCHKRRQPMTHPTIDRKAMAKVIAETRRSKGLNVRDFGDLFNVSRTTISNYENGYQTPNIEFVVRLAELRGQSVDDILNRCQPSHNTLPRGGQS